jgi:hypothetical protein
VPVPPTPDPKVVVADLARLAPELTPAGAEMLAREMPQASGSDLAEISWLTATRGFTLLEREQLRELGPLIEEVYATLPPEDQAWMVQYMRDVRDGSLGPEDSLRGRRLLTDGVNRLAPESRQRLQALVEKAIRGAIEAQRIAKSRTPPPPTPSLAPPQGFQPQPPNTPPPEPALAPRSSPSPPTRGEAYWRERMRDARAKVTRLKKELADLEKAAAREATAGADPKKRLERLAQTRVELAEAERAITEIEEEARKAGALPGWLRE